jgi:AcrR family transcriptional regulator
MGRNKAVGLKANSDEPAQQYVPSWHQRTIEHSLQDARARAYERNNRFVEAGVELLAERDVPDFTIQEVINRSGMSLWTFYAFFDCKDSLLLAVYEFILCEKVLPMYRERCAAVKEPVQRVKAWVEAASDWTGIPARISRGTAVIHLRRFESRPDDLVSTSQPLRDFIVELLVDVAASGRLREDVDVATQARMLQDFLTASMHSTVLSSAAPVNPDELWAFVSGAILRP